MIYDAMACTLVVLGEVIAVFLLAVLIQGLVYRITKLFTPKGFSIWNWMMAKVKKEIYGSGKHMYISVVNKK